MSRGAVSRSETVAVGQVDVEQDEIGQQLHGGRQEFDTTGGGVPTANSGDAGWLVSLRT